MVEINWAEGPTSHRDEDAPVPVIDPVAPHLRHRAVGKAECSRYRDGAAASFDDCVDGPCLVHGQSLSELNSDSPAYFSLPPIDLPIHGTLMNGGQWHIRLVKALTRKGWAQSELSCRTGIDANNIYKYTSGAVAQPRGDTLRRIADALGVNLIWLRDGVGPELSAVPVVGYVGAGEMFMPASEAELGELALDFAAADPIAVVVRGASMAPVYRSGDYLICSRISNGDLDACVNKDCVVQTAEGLGYIKRVVQGAAPGSFTLLSYAADPIPDVILSWCAPVVWIKRA